MEKSSTATTEKERNACLHRDGCERTGMKDFHVLGFEKRKPVGEMFFLLFGGGESVLVSNNLRLVFGQHTADHGEHVKRFRCLRDAQVTIQMPCINLSITMREASR